MSSENKLVRTNSLAKDYCQAVDNGKACLNEAVHGKSSTPRGHKLFCDMHKEFCKRCRGKEKIDMPVVCGECYQLVKHDLLLWKS